MDRIKKVLVTLLALSLLAGTLCPTARAKDDPIIDEYNVKDDPIIDEYNMLDLFVARPMGVAAGIVGTAFFVVSLPFTLSTGSVNAAAKMFISKPFHFSFSREFPDRNVRPDGYDYY